MVTFVWSVSKKYGEEETTDRNGDECVKERKFRKVKMLQVWFF